MKIKTNLTIIAGTVGRGLSISAILRKVLLVNTKFAPSKRRSRFLGSAESLVLPLVLGLTALGLHRAVACDEICNDDDYNVGFGSFISDVGGSNTSLGESPLFLNQGGNDNTVVGAYAISSANYPTADTAVGSKAMEISGGNYCVAVGYFALHTEAGDFNTALGYDTMSDGGFSTGYNTATGAEAMHFSDGTSNTADGAFALFNCVDGSYNTAVGRGALYTGGGGDYNTAVGYHALNGLYNADNNVAVGSGAAANLTSGTNNIAIGTGAAANLTSGTNNILIGALGVDGDNNTIRIGTIGTQTTVYVHGIYGTTTTRGLPVVIEPSGHLGTRTSSARFKENIQPMDKVSEAILSLQPVTFRYKKELDPEATPQFGLVAEQVQKVDPDLVVRDEQGKPYSVRYEAVNAMLLNEFLKEYDTVKRLEATVVQQQKDFQATVAELRSAVKEQAAQIQKVSSQVQVGRPAPQMVLNDR